MALQTSGAISLNDIHVEAGGTSGTQATINDTDIRALINKASGATMSFSEWYGASATQVFTVTQGTLSQQYSTKRGFYDDTSTGSVSPSVLNSATKTGMNIEECARVNASSGMFFQFELVYSSAISASEFTSLQFTANGTLTTLTTAESSTTSTRGGFGRRWTWSSSNGLDSTEISNITAEWDGSGDIDVTFVV